MRVATISFKFVLVVCLFISVLLPPVGLRKTNAAYNKCQAILTSETGRHHNVFVVSILVGFTVSLRFYESALSTHGVRDDDDLLTQSLTACLLCKGHLCIEPL